MNSDDCSDDWKLITSESCHSTLIHMKMWDMTPTNSHLSRVENHLMNSISLKINQKILLHKPCYKPRGQFSRRWSENRGRYFPKANQKKLLMYKIYTFSQTHLNMVLNWEGKGSLASKLSREPRCGGLLVFVLDPFYIHCPYISPHICPWEHANVPLILLKGSH